MPGGRGEGGRRAAGGGREGFSGSGGSPDSFSARVAIRRGEKGPITGQRKISCKVMASSGISRVKGKRSVLAEGEVAMMLAVRVQAASVLAGVEVMEALPEPPALCWAGFLVGCGMSNPPIEFFEWTVMIREVRPNVPIGAIFMESTSPEVLSFASRIAIDPVITSSDPADVARACREVSERSIQGKVVEEWVAQYAPPAEAIPILVAVAEVGVGGGKVRRLARHLQIPVSSLYRKIAEAGLPAPGFLLRVARVRGVQLGCDAGVDIMAALRRGDWRERRGFLTVTARLR